MDIKELRIGNFVNLHDEQTEIDSVHFRDYYNEIDTEEDYSPIPLTEEWLVKLGFAEHEFNKKDFYYGNYSVTTFTGFKFWIVDSVDAPCYVEIKYVHSLQNLYFALTGEDLVVKE